MIWGRFFSHEVESSLFLIDKKHVGFDGNAVIKLLLKGLIERLGLVSTTSMLCVLGGTQQFMQIRLCPFWKG